MLSELGNLCQRRGSSSTTLTDFADRQVEDNTLSLKPSDILFYSSFEVLVVCVGVFDFVAFHWRINQFHCYMVG